jgi:protein SCO1/2
MRWASLILVLATASLGRADGFAPQGEFQSSDDKMPNMNVLNKIGAQLPLDTVLRDEKDNPITLGEAMGGKPTLLVFAYFHCPQLCNVVLTQLVDQMRKMPYTVGNEFNVVTISIDPKETPITAWGWKKHYLKRYGREVPDTGWRFLTAKQPQIDLLTKTSGFVYEEVAKPLFQPVGSERKNKEYAHPAVVIVLQPEGIISRYLFNLEWSDQDLKYSLIDANSDLGNFTDTELRRCFMSFDSTKGKYTMDVWKVMRFFGVLTVVSLIGFVIREFVRGKKSNVG